MKKLWLLALLTAWVIPSVALGEVLINGVQTYDVDAVATGEVTVGTAGSAAGNITQHDAGTITLYDDGNDTSVVVGPVANGTTTLGLTGSLNVSGTVYGATYASDGSVTDAELKYINSLSSNAQDQLDARCLESVFGTAIGVGLTLDGTTLKVDATYKLDDWGTCDDNTDLNVSTSAHGLAPKAPNDNKQHIGGTGTWATMREFSKLNLTEDTSISEAQILANKYIANQGDDGEADLTLPAVSYTVGVIFIVEEAQNIEINPPSSEAFDLDGVTLDADDCVDSDSTVGSKISALRMQNASGTWIWSLDSIRGNWTEKKAMETE